MILYLIIIGRPIYNDFKTLIKSYLCLVVQDRSSSQYSVECLVECKGELFVVQKYSDLRGDMHGRIECKSSVMHV